MGDNYQGISYKPRGMYAALITPFTEEGRVNEEELRRMISWLVEKGIDGVVPLGSLGEFIHLNSDEKKRVIKLSVQESNGQIDVLPGATGTHSADCIDQGKYAQEVGADGIMVAPPYYLKMTQEMVEAHYEDIAYSLPEFPLVLYTIPIFTTPISYDVVKRLSRITNVVGMKDSGGSMVDQMNYIDKIKIAGEDISYITGREEMLFPALVAGSNGAVTGSCGIIPEVIMAIYNSFLEGNYEKALQLQYTILYFVRAMMAVPFPLGFKAALECRGFNPGPSKQVLSSAEEYNYFKVRSRIYKILHSIYDSKFLKDHSLNCGV